MAKSDLPQQLNICIVATKFPILGRAADHGFLWPIARALAQQGHKVTVLAWKNPQGRIEIEQDGVRAHFLGHDHLRSSQFPQRALHKFTELHSAEPFHIVHSVDASGLLIGIRRRRFRIAMTYGVEATDMSQIFSILSMSRESLGSLLKTAVSVGYRFVTSYLRKDRRLLRTADAVFVTSPLQKIFLERHYLYPEMKTYLVPYGIEISDLSPREKSDELRGRLNIPLTAKTVVTITDMVELEEMANLLIAFEQVVIKKPSSRMIIVGDGPRRKEIEFNMLKLALGNKVIFTGAVSNVDLPDYIALADVFINLSARTSGFEPSMLEAMAQKKVIIGSEMSPISTIVEDGIDGFLIRPADISTLAQLVLYIFTDQLPSEAIGERARQKVINLFDMGKMVAQTLDAYYITLSKTGYYRRRSLSLRWPPVSNA